MVVQRIRFLIHKVSIWAFLNLFTSSHDNLVTHVKECIWKYQYSLTNDHQETAFSEIPWVYSFDRWNTALGAVGVHQEEDVRRILWQCSGCGWEIWEGAKKLGHILSESRTMLWLGISIILFSLRRQTKMRIELLIGEDTYNAGPLVFVNFQWPGFCFIVS